MDNNCFEIDNSIISRPWGTYQTIKGNNNSKFKVKHIVVFPNSKLSLQSHNRRSEHWVITAGIAKVQVGNNIFILHLLTLTF